MIDIKKCPSNPSHQVFGGYPIYVCAECATEWQITKGQKRVLYRQYDTNGAIVKHWKVPLDKAEGSNDEGEIA